MSKIETRTGTQAKAQSHAHPTTRTFLNIGAILFVITAIEFGIVYIEGIRTTIIVTLFLLSALKFWLVAGYFMHLKWESKLLSWVFAVGILLALLITFAQKYVNLA